ncbi:MAG: ribonuclease H-like domain-containing protein [candidate division SR1 bacterium]|nr:ribonuclease H-like domain-containing protein [candidate division SR1 bacterium]
MYKRFTLDELKTVQNTFISNFYSILKREHCQMASDLFKKIFREGNEIYYMTRGDFTFRFQNNNEEYTLMDEKQKIQVVLDEQGKRDFQSMVKNYILKKEKITGQKTIEQILLDEFHTGKYSTIGGKNYMVYDIETDTNIQNLKETKFLLAYAMYPTGGNKMTYEYVDQEGLKAFVQKMLDFDGYIVGFNSIAFDNMVSVYNVGGSDEDIKKLDEKTIDLFLFVRAMTGKRLGLNKIAEALVNVSKTLTSGAEGEVLYKKYIEENDLDALEEFKRYCKNDVRMTMLVFLYLMHFKKLFIEGDEITFTLEDLVNQSRQAAKETGRMVGQNMFE